MRVRRRRVGCSGIEDYSWQKTTYRRKLDAGDFSAMDHSEKLLLPYRASTTPTERLSPLRTYKEASRDGEKAP
jgi:hypothetical protein